MSDAPQQPEFAPGGAPLSLLIDFDGTISLQDVGEVLLGRFVADQDAVRQMDELYVAGVKGSRELTAWDLDVLPRDAGLLLAAVDELPLDDTFSELVSVVGAAGGSLEIVSDGFGFHVERLLARLGHADLPVATNSAQPGRGGSDVTFPYGHPTCLVCGTCKRDRVMRHKAARRAVVFVGDGPSDRYAAWHADVVFAKDSLAAWCEAQGVAWRPWDRLSEVAMWVREALSDGRLPPSAAAFDSWAGTRPARTPPFICGPEVWDGGEGRPGA